MIFSFALHCFRLSVNDRGYHLAGYNPTGDHPCPQLEPWLLPSVTHSATLLLKAIHHGSNFSLHTKQCEPCSASGVFTYKYEECLQAVHPERDTADLYK